MRFNAANVPDNNTERDDSPIPDGTYTVKVSKATEIDNRSGTGRYLELVLDVLGPVRAGARLWARYTTEHHTSQRGVDIGLGQLKDAARALGKPAFDHEVELVGCVGQCKVGRQRDNAERNEVKGWVVERVEHVPSEPAPFDVPGMLDRIRRGQTYGAAGSSAPPSAIPHPAEHEPDFTDEEVPF